MLRWIERGLLAGGLALAGWSGLVMAQAKLVDVWPPAPAAPPAAGRPVPAGAWVARIEAPAVDLSATVLEGSDDRTLSLAAGRIAGTAFPGDAGNVGIAGHRDTTFRPLRHLKIGDAIVLRTGHAAYAYEVSKTMIVDPDAVDVLAPTPEPSLTLVTCYPFTYFGNAPKRYIVRAVLVGEGR